MAEHSPTTHARVSSDEAAVPLPIDRAAAGPPRHVQVLVPGGAPGNAARWTAVFAAWLYRHGSGELLHLVSDVSREITAVRIPVTGGDTLDSIAAGLDSAAAVLVTGPLAGRVLAGLPAPPGMYGETTHIHLALEGGSVSLCADERLWTRATIEAFADQLAAMSTGTATVASLPVLTAEERARLLVACNDTATRCPHTDYLAPLREQFAARAGEPALVQGARTVTYRELDGRSNQVAARLRRLGAKPGERVGLLCPRSVDFVIAVIGVLKTGAAAVLLDPANPDARLAYMIEDAAPLAMITVAEQRARVPNGVAALLPGDFDGEPDESIAVEVTGETISHLFYTSGSTGQPKGVLIRHATLANTISWIERAHAVRPGDRASWLTAPGFVVQVLEWMPYLARGVPVHVGDAANPTPEQIHAWLIEQRITHTLLASALAEQVWRMPWPADTPLRVMLATGERVVRWPPTGLPFKVVVEYGTTETMAVLSTLDLGAGIDCTSDATPADVRAVRPVSAGKPVLNARVYLLDDAGEPVGVGMVGRVHVAGAGMSAGYHRPGPEAAARFKPNTLPEEPGPLLYNTGDLARMRADGAIEILGRSDSQVKIRGFRVDLGEVENAVRSAPAVSEAVVVTRELEPGDVWLVAYVAGRDGAPEPARVRAHVADKLPHYMVPGLVVVLDALPRLSNGKVDRAGLPAPMPAIAAGGPFTGPDEPVQRELAAMWSKLFRRSDIGPASHFFELGGHSLLGFRLIKMVRTSFAVELDPPDLWAHPTLADLAALIAGRRDSSR